MNEKQLKRSLNSIGKGCFAKYFEAFIDSSITDDDLVDGLMKIENYEESGARTRVIQSRRIVREEKALDALHIIRVSKNVKTWVVSKAEFLIQIST